MGKCVIKVAVQGVQRQGAGISRAPVARSVLFSKSSISGDNFIFMAVLGKYSVQPGSKIEVDWYEVVATFAMVTRGTPCIRM